MPAVLLSAALLFAGCGSAETVDTAYSRGVAALTAQDYTTAVTEFELAVSEEGRSAEGLRGQGIAYLHLGEYAQAAQLFGQALDSIEYPDQNAEFTEDVMFYQAQAYVEDEQYDKALNIYNKLIDGELSGQAYLLRGKVYAIQDKFGQAGQDFQKAIELDGSYEIYLQVYEVYVENNRQADGATFLKDAESKAPESSDDYYQLGRINYELKDYEKAESYLTEAVNQGNRDAILLLGRVYLDAGDESGAEDLYNSCLESDDTKAIGYNGLALCAILEEDYSTALTYIQSGLEISDSSVREELLYNEIVVYEKMHDFSTALTKIEAFLEQFPTNESAVREEKFIRSRVEESSGTTVNETEIDWDEVYLQQMESESVSSDSADTESTDDAYSYDTAEDSYTDADGDGIADETYDTTYSDGTYYDGTTEQYYSDGYDASEW